MHWQLILALQAALAFAAAIKNLKTVRCAVSCESAPFMRTGQWCTVANSLSTGFEVRKCVQGLSCALQYSTPRHQTAGDRKPFGLPRLNQ